MRPFIGSALVTLIIGIMVGVYLGWEQVPIQYHDSSMCQFSEDYKEQYTLMVARAFQAEGDYNKALNRLLPLRASNAESCLRDSTTTSIDNIPAWVQEVTERYRTRGANLEDICDLATLSAAFGRQIPGYADRPGTVCDQFRS